MNSPEQIEKITALVAMLDERLEPARGENRRRQPRIPVRLPLVVALLTAAGPIPVDAFTRNISLSGVGFVSRRLFNAEERIALLLELPRMPAKQVLARVTFTRYVRSGLYESGAEFLQCVVLPASETPSRSPLARIPTQWLAGVRQAQVAAASVKAAAEAIKAATAGTIIMPVTSEIPAKPPAIVSGPVAAMK